MDPVNERDLDWTETERDDASFRRKRLGEAAGGEGLGTSLYELPSGGKSWPYHYHAANEEALYVLAGRGTLRTPDGERPLEPGDYVVLPTGERGAHRITNDAEDPLRYLLVSTMRDPDVTVYPDSEKLGVFVGSPPGGRGERTLGGYFRQHDSVGYWDEEQE